MSSEPNPNMDKMLRDYAKKRREEAGASAEMHAATRKMLQAEVARTLGKQAAASTGARTSPRFTWWPRLAWGGAVAAVLAVALFSLNSFLSRKAPSRQMEVASYKTPAPAPATAPPAALVAPAKKAEQPAVVAQESANTLSFAPAPIAEANAEPKPKEADEALALRRKNKDVVRPEPQVVAKPTPSGYAKEKQTNVKRDESESAAAFGGDDTNGSTALYTSAASSSPGGAFDRVSGVAGQKPTGSLSLRPLPDSLNLGAVTNGSASFAYNEKEKSLGSVSSEPARNFPPQVTSGGTVLDGKVENLTNSVALNGFGASTRALAKTAAIGAAAPASAAAEPAGLTQNFRQQNLHPNLRENLQSPPQPNVLSSFQMVRNDSHIKIIDADGSIYEGSVVQPLLALQENKSATKKMSDKIAPGEERPVKAEAVNGPQSNAEQDNTFRVSGMNRTLKRKIVFEGTYVSGTQAASVGSFQKSSGTVQPSANFNDVTKAVRPTEAASGVPASQNFVRGLVKIGGKTEFRIEAVEAP